MGLLYQCYTIHMPEVTLGEEIIEYSIVRSRRGSIGASILADGTLAVKAPILIPEFLIRFWIYNTY